MIEKKGLGLARVNRVNISLSNDHNTKLSRLATACNMKPTTLAGRIIEQQLNDPNYVIKLQDELNIYVAYRVLPVTTTHGVEYVLYDRGMK